MRTAAGSKDYPRSPERRHFRGENARKSVEYLESRGIGALFDDLYWAGPAAVEVITAVRKWVGFGPWIAFKVADMLERLAVRPVRFNLETVLYEGSPTEGAYQLWETEGRPAAAVGSVTCWATERLANSFGTEPAPPRYERPIGLQEFETILCKWKSYRSGHYQIGEDVEATERGLRRFVQCPLAKRLLDAGTRGGLW